MSSVSLIDGHIDEPRMTDEEIIRALEHCISASDIDTIDSCKECSFDEECSKDCDAVLKHALDLINRKNETVKYQAKQIVDLKIKNKEQRSEIERLKAEVEKQKERTNDVIRSYVENEWN